MKTKIIVKCVSCKAIKEISSEQKEIPFCDQCFNPMIVVKVEIKK